MDSTETLEACTLTEELSTLDSLSIPVDTLYKHNGMAILALFVSILSQRDKPTDGRSSFVL